MAIDLIFSKSIINMIYKVGDEFLKESTITNKIRLQKNTELLFFSNSCNFNAPYQLMT